MFDKKLKPGEKTAEELEKIVPKLKESTTESSCDTNIAEQSEAAAAPETSCDANIAEQSVASASCDTNIGSETFFNFFLFIYYKKDYFSGKDIGDYIQNRSSIAEGEKYKLLKYRFEPEKGFKYPVSGKRYLKFQTHWMMEYPWFVIFFKYFQYK